MNRRTAIANTLAGIVAAGTLSPMPQWLEEALTPPRVKLIGGPWDGRTHEHPPHELDLKHSKLLVMIGFNPETAERHVYRYARTLPCGTPEFTYRGEFVRA